MMICISTNILCLTAQERRHPPKVEGISRKVGEIPRKIEDRELLLQQSFYK
jgi:hypothetical protein